MQVSAIRYNTPHSLPVNKNSSQNKLSFKGYTHKIEYYAQKQNPSHFENPKYDFFFYWPENLEETGFKLDRANMTEREREILDFTKLTPPRIYIASPNEEIPPEVYKTHTHVQKNNLWLSQIKKDCMRGYMNFASNATCEMEHYKEFQKKRDEIVEKNTKEIEQIQRHLETMTKNSPESTNTAAEEKYSSRLFQLANEISEIQQKTQRADKNMDKAQKRYNVLKKLDDLCEQLYSKRIEESDLNSSFYYSYSYSMNKLKDKLEILEKQYNAKQEQAKRLQKISVPQIAELARAKKAKDLLLTEEEIEKVKREIKSLKDEKDFKVALIEKIEHEEIPALKEKIEEEFKNVEQFYREYYPEWCDI